MFVTCFAHHKCFPLQFVALVTQVTAFVFGGMSRQKNMTWGWRWWWFRLLLLVQWYSLVLSYLCHLFDKLNCVIQLVVAVWPLQFGNIRILFTDVVKKNVTVHSCQVKEMEEERLPPPVCFSQGHVLSNQLVTFINAAHAFVVMLNNLRLTNM